MSITNTLATTTRNLTERIHEHEEAKRVYAATLATVRDALSRLEAAHTAEVEAHDAVQKALTERRKSRRIGSA